MNIGIIVEKNLDGQKGGLEVYTYNLIRNLLKVDKKNNYFFIKDSKNTGFPRENEIKINLGKTPARKVLKNSFNIPVIVKKYQLDIIHDPCQMGPFLLPMKAKKILTLHDLFPLTHPQTAPSRYSPYIYKYLLPQVLKSTDKVIVISKNTRRDLLNYFPHLKGKITVIYEAADESFRKTGNLERVKRKYTLDFPFIFSLGILNPIKNFTTLIKAFSKLKNRGLKHKLVIGGKKGWRFENIFQQARDLVKKGEIIFSDFIPEEDLPYFYNLADLFVFPSLYEGFGIPILEAMACGCPVITSNISSMPEVAGRAALFINNPLDIDEIASKITQVLTNSNLKKGLIKKGFVQAAKFSWERTARETIKVYEEVCRR
ncbi:MAG: glycosyltransferase family 4 protein [Candidatus Marinimicrobia bacterium]|nr:glycosyltransferase family 4 protein [Candidatus Neomarinimicrobiota bacterium]